MKNINRQSELESAISRKKGPTYKQNSRQSPEWLQQKSQKKFTRRALFAGGVQLFAMSGLLYQLRKLQLLEGKQYLKQAEDNRILVRPTAPVRGRILDRHGTPLAINRENLRIMAIPAELKKPQRVLSRLTSLIGLSPKEKLQFLTRLKRAPKQLPILVKDNLSWQQFAAVNLHLPELEGIFASTGWKRQYKNARNFAHILGVVGPGSRIDLAEQPVLTLPGMKTGKSGVEKAFEDRLSGKPGNIQIEVDARGRLVRHIREEPPVSGHDVLVTVEPALQAAVMEILAVHEPAAAVVINIKNGEVLCLASAPTYNLNHLLPPVTPENWKALHDNPDKPMVNRAVQGQYPPGSTFKMVTALAGLKTGAISPTTHFHCSGAYKHGKHTYRCWKRSGHGSVDLIRSLRESCDVFFYETAVRTGIEEIAAMARRLGLGEIHDMGMSGLKGGLVPNPDWKRLHFSKGWYVGESILAAIGQGYVLATPLQLAVMTARIASGKKVAPLIAKPVDSQKQNASDTSLQPFPSLEISEKHLALVRQGMFEAVNARAGTGKRAAIKFQGALLAGKTGTSQVISTGGKSIQANHSHPKKFRDHALFTGYAPYNNPEYAVSLIVEHGGSGGKTAAPLAGKILQKTLEIMARPQTLTANIKQQG